MFKVFRTPTLSFLKSLDAPSSPISCHPDALKYKNFARTKVALTRKLFDIFNEGVFGGRLPGDMGISWSSRLTKTAGGVE